MGRFFTGDKVMLVPHQGTVQVKLCGFHEVCARVHGG